MHLFRRSPEPVYHGYEVQMFSCMKCDAEITRSADRKGKPHPPAVLIDLEEPQGIARGVSDETRATAWAAGDARRGALARRAFAFSFLQNVRS